MESLAITFVILASAAAAFFALRRRRMPVRLPVLTLSVVSATLAFSVSANIAPLLLNALSRDPSALMHLQWWRIVTPLLVQDGGWLGTISNTISLLIVGLLAESLLPRTVWAIGYLGSGLVGEVVAYTLLPHQGFAGNSIAILGLAATASVVALVRGGPIARIAGIGSLVFGIGMLLAGNLHGAAYAAGALAGLVAALLMRRTA